LVPITIASETTIKSSIYGTIRTRREKWVHYRRWARAGHGWAAQALNLDFSQVSGHLINLLRTPSIREELAGQGYTKDQLHPWVGSRIKTTGTPPDSSETPLETPPTPEKPGGYPQDTQKTPAYRAPNSEDQVDPPGYPDSEGGWTRSGTRFDSPRESRGTPRGGP